MELLRWSAIWLSVLVVGNAAIALFGEARMKRFAWYVGVTLLIAVGLDVAYSVLCLVSHTTPDPNVGGGLLLWGLIGAWLIDRRRRRRATPSLPPPPPRP